MKILEINHTYLIRMVGWTEELYSITILLVSEYAYYIRWNNELETAFSWGYNGVNGFY